MRFRAFAAASGLVASFLGTGCLIYGEDLLATGGAAGAGSGGSPTSSASMGGAAGAGTGTTSTSSGAPCSVLEDCPKPDSACQKRLCTDSVCTTENLPANTMVADPTPGDCHGVVCDTAGGTITVEDSADAQNDGKFCTIDECKLGTTQHSPKVGYACSENGGKHCNDKGDCVECIVDGDCLSNACKNFKCAPSGCGDGVKNGLETDTDCGGPCQGCASGKVCKTSADCKGGLCTGGMCQPTCTDGEKNKAETDIDCGGGTCPTCADTKVCLKATDCQSGICTTGKCAAASCMDGKKNGAETDIDCGGPACPSCPLDHIVINEIDYDMVGIDTMEFIEVYNATLFDVSLLNLKLVLIDGGSNAPYDVIDLAPGGALAPGQYLVVGEMGFPVAPGTVKLNFNNSMNQLQNGLSSGVGSPDGVALIDSSKKTLIDAVSYEGAITTANLNTWGMGMVSLVEGVALSGALKDEAGGTLCRYPNAKDTDVSAADWLLCSAPTPGAPNKQ